MNGQRFWRKYLSHWLRYPPYFFRNAPVTMWRDFFKSTHRVALDCTRASCALEDEPDVWSRGALRGQFMQWAEDKLNTPNGDLSHADPTSGVTTKKTANGSALARRNG